MHTPSKHGARSTDDSSSSLVFAESALAATTVEGKFLWVRMVWLLLLVLRVLAARDDGEKAQTAQEGEWLLAKRRRTAATEGNLMFVGRIIDKIDVFTLGEALTMTTFDKSAWFLALRLVADLRQRREAS